MTFWVIVILYGLISLGITEYVFGIASKEGDFLALPRNKRRLYPFVFAAAIPYSIIRLLQTLWRKIR